MIKIKCKDCFDCIHELKDYVKTLLPIGHKDTKVEEIQDPLTLREIKNEQYDSMEAFDLFDVVKQEMSYEGEIS